MKAALIVCVTLLSSLTAHAHSYEESGRLECTRPGQTKVIATMSLSPDKCMYLAADRADIRLDDRENYGRQKFCSYSDTGKRDFEVIYGGYTSDADYVGLKNVNAQEGIEVEVGIIKYNKPVQKTLLTCRVVKPVGTIIVPGLMKGDYF